MSSGCPQYSCALDSSLTLANPVLSLTGLSRVVSDHGRPDPTATLECSLRDMSRCSLPKAMRTMPNRSERVPSLCVSRQVGDHGQPMDSQAQLPYLQAILQHHRHDRRFSLRDRCPPDWGTGDNNRLVRTTPLFRYEVRDNEACFGAAAMSAMAKFEAGDQSHCLQSSVDCIKPSSPRNTTLSSRGGDECMATDTTRRPLSLEDTVCGVNG